MANGKWLHPRLARTTSLEGAAAVPLARPQLKSTRTGALALPASQEKACIAKPIRGDPLIHFFKFAIHASSGRSRQALHWVVAACNCSSIFHRENRFRRHIDSERDCVDSPSRYNSPYKTDLVKCGNDPLNCQEHLQSLLQRVQRVCVCVAVSLRRFASF
ncbi:hypothetical protein PPTG_21685 [Phytophthora nicotianae INRA-310]|uniref:Uncharacterized protein n=1 Tax=Phytophthora nicotianae (strain INRA-310) TaxID=761204 RepID=W2QWZ8_PHYN3|nr:hypothetical protein PPTG_21685 [Phytophthora nicotianae INRA-310]ETN17747.1 hypothetical protein PPTG_21685 [Phytophthora nicotianae INRA-310]